MGSRGGLAFAAFLAATFRFHRAGFKGRDVGCDRIVTVVFDEDENFDFGRAAGGGFHGLAVIGEDGFPLGRSGPVGAAVDPAFLLDVSEVFEAVLGGDFGQLRTVFAIATEQKDRVRLHALLGEGLGLAVEPAGLGLGARLVLAILIFDGTDPVAGLTKRRKKK